MELTKEQQEQAVKLLKQFVEAHDLLEQRQGNVVDPYFPLREARALLASLSSE
jgi:hypothetical protein